MQNTRYTGSESYGRLPFHRVSSDATVNRRMIGWYNRPRSSCPSLRTVFNIASTASRDRSDNWPPLATLHTLPVGILSSGTFDRRATRPPRPSPHLPGTQPVISIRQSSQHVDGFHRPASQSTADHAVFHADQQEIASRIFPSPWPTKLRPLPSLYSKANTYTNLKSSSFYRRVFFNTRDGERLRHCR